MNTTVLGLEKNDTQKMTEGLNVLLADLMIYYQNLRGVHWNIKGEHFFTLHEKFEELYDEAQVNVDEVAERILTLGGTPIHTYEDYIKTSTLRVGKNVSGAKESVELILDSITELLKIERSLLDLSGEQNDEGTNAMISDFITSQEKTAWMLKAFLG